MNYIKITNCIWEKSDLDKRVAEISFEVNDSIDRETMRDLEKEYEYIVVKLKPCLGFNFTDFEYVFVKHN